MRLLSLGVLVGAMLASGCCSTCGNCGLFGCSKNGESCGAACAQRGATNSATKTMAAKPATAMPQSFDNQVQPASHQAMPKSPAMMQEHQPMLPEGEPSAMTIPPPPASTKFSEPDSSLPTPRQIAARDTSASDEWLSSADSASEAETEPAQPKAWTPRMPMRSTSTVGLSN